MKRKGRSGARSRTHLESAIKAINAVHRKHARKEISISLDTAPGVSGKEFAYPGPKFVYDVLKGIDTEVTISEVSTALRKALGGRGLQKSKKSSG